MELIQNSSFQGNQLTLAQRIELLKNVVDDKTAFSYLIASCAQIIKDFEKNFPDSNFGVPKPPSGGQWRIGRIVTVGLMIVPAGIIAVLEAPLLLIIGIPIVIGAWQQSKLPK